MSEYYSRITGVVIHKVVNTNIEKFNKRLEFTPSDCNIQLAKVKITDAVLPHAHVRHTRTTARTHEAWFVLSGALGIALYDIDGTLLGEETLYSGMMLVTTGGGHSCKALAPDTDILEIKNGPYESYIDYERLKI